MTTDCPASHNKQHCWHPGEDKLGFGTKYQRCCHCGETREAPQPLDYDDVMSGGPFGDADA